MFFNDFNCHCRDKQVRVQDLIDALTKLQAKPAKDGESDKEAEARRSRIEQLLVSIDQDADGIIDADLVLEVSLEIYF